MESACEWLLGDYLLLELIADIPYLAAELLNSVLYLKVKRP